MTSIYINICNTSNHKNNNFTLKLYCIYYNKSIMKLLKGTVLYSIILGTCPVCQNESMYKKKNPFILNQLFEMHDRCTHCNTKYKIEPSFFYGAMYVSYAIGVALGVAVFLMSHLLLQNSLLTSFILICIAVIGLLPLEMRLSRNIWINLFMKYNKKKSKKTNQND